jgi:2-iminobutanoate/2-iminopropanoate deaminase
MSSISIKQRHIQTAGAPAAIGPYSQAIVANGMVFCTGQVAIDPETNKLVGEDIVTQTRRVLDNLKAVLEAAGSSLHNVVMTTVYLANFADFPQMNETYHEYFADIKPARSTIEAGLPGKILVQIDCIAIVSSQISLISVVEARESESTYDLDLDRDF